MPALEYFLVCRSVQEDVNTNEMSFVNVLEDICPESFPISIPRAIGVSLWNFEPGEDHADYQATLIVKLPGKPDAAFPMNLSRKARRCRAVQGILEIPIEGPGEITFEVLLNLRHEATHTVTVHPLGVRDSRGVGEPLAEASRTPPTRPG